MKLAVPKSYVILMVALIVVVINVTVDLSSYSSDSSWALYLEYHQ